MPNTTLQGEGGPGQLWLPVLAAAVAGPALQLQQVALWSPGVYGALGALGAALLALAVRGRSFGWRRLSGAFAAAALLAAAVCGLRAQVFAGQALAPELEGRDLRIIATVAAMPQYSAQGVRMRMEIDSARDAQGPVRLPGLVQLGWYSNTAGSAAQAGLPSLHAGERWEMTVRLKAPHGNLNPHGFDYELWLWEQGIQATGYVRGGTGDAAPVLLASTWAHPVERARQAVRDAILARVDDARLGGIVAALVTGDQRVIDRADWDIFRATGVAHLMSISGLHITLFAWVAALVTGWLWRRSTRLCLAWPAQHAALAGGLLLAFGYALFSGWGVPAQRTVGMLAIVSLLRLAGYRWPWPAVWLLACAVVVSVDPWALLQAGFWLSFVAVGVLFATDAGTTARGASARVKAMLREQWVVTVALTPLSLLLFGQVSTVGLPANLLAIPWVTLVVTPLALAGVAVPACWDAAALALQALGAVLRWLAALPLATIVLPAPPLWAGVAGVVGGIALAMRWPWSLRALGVPLLLPLLLWQAPRPPAGQFELMAADIGQGNAVLVRTASHTLIYDAGPTYGSEADAGHRVLVPLLRALGEQVDTLVLSHRDTDHTGGAPALLAMQPQASLLSSIEAAHPLQALRRATRCEAGQRWVWDGVAFEILHPQPQDYERALKPNALSCVLRIASPSAVALMTGDIGVAEEGALLRQGAALRADVLLVPHHGSKTSSSPAFLDAVQPRWALVQSGYRNRYGHPAPPVLARYEAHGIRVVDSPHCGAARWHSGAPQELVCQREQARRYWHHSLPGTDTGP